MKNRTQFTRKRLVTVIVVLILLLCMIFREKQFGLASSSTYKAIFDTDQQILYYMELDT